MKFPQLQIGQRFAYQGKTYRKATPLLADLEDAEGQRLIPRSAMVEPLEPAAAITEAPSEIPVALVDRAMEQLSSDINRITKDSGLDAEGVNNLLCELQGALLRTRRKLNLP